MAQLGSVGPSRGLAQPFSPQRAPGASLVAVAGGLADFGGAMQNMSASMDAQSDATQALSLAQKSRREALDRADALVRFTKLQGEYGRGLSQLQTDYAGNGGDFAAQADNYMEEQLQGFQATLPEHLKNDFLPRIESFRQGEKNSNFTAQLGIEGNYFKTGLQELQDSAMEQIYKGGDVVAVRASVDEYLANSPFPKFETEELRKEAYAQLEELDFSLQAAEEAKNWQEVRGTVKVGEKELPASMPGHVLGFLDAISGSESGGEDNVMYTPDGTARRYFDSYEDHPNQPVTITSGPHAGEKSSAAGRFQFIYATWKAAQEALGLKDFSPENQKRAAWWVAGQDYSRRTGRDIEADLASGDPVLIEAVRKELGPTWQGLIGLSAEKFYAKVTGTAAAPSGMLDDPTYENLSYGKKLGLVETAQGEARKLATQAAEQQKARLASITNEFQRTIAEGGASDLDITEFAKQNNLSYESEAALRNLRASTQADTVAAEKFAKALNDPAHVFSDKDAGAFDAVYRQVGSERMQGMDEEFLRDSFLPTVRDTGLMPKTAIEQLSGMYVSQNPQEASFALGALNALRAQNPGLFDRSFSDSVVADTVYFAEMAPYLPEAARIEQLQMQRSLEGKAALGQVRERVQREVQNTPSEFQVAGIADRLELDYETIDAPAAAAMESSFRRLYEREYIRYGNHKDTAAAAAALMKSQWGSVELGGSSYIMQNPPALAGVQPIGGSYQWLDKVVRSDLALAPEVPYRLVSDHITQAQKLQGRPPSYMVSTELAPGIFMPRIGADNLPLRINFGTPEVQKVTQVEGSIWHNKKRNMQATQQRAVAGVLQSDDLAGVALLGLSSAGLRQLDRDKPSVNGFDSGRQSFNFDEAPEPVLDIILKGLGIDDRETFAQDQGQYDYDELLEAFDPSVLSENEKAVLGAYGKSVRRALQGDR